MPERLYRPMGRAATVDASYDLPRRPEHQQLGRNSSAAQWVDNIAEVRDKRQLRRLNECVIVALRAPPIRTMRRALFQSPLCRKFAHSIVEVRRYQGRAVIYRTNDLRLSGTPSPVLLDSLVRVKLPRGSGSGD
jgi:hypothetical protein